MPQEKACPVCQKPLGRNKNACSKECYAILRSHTRTCVVCQTEFFCPPSSQKKTCSPACSSIWRKSLHQSGLYKESVRTMQRAIPQHPLTGRFPTHVNAKHWVIQDPDGNLHECRNLKNWLRQHEDMLDGTVMQAWDGIAKIKYSMQGKRKNPSSSWKGWRLIEYGD